MSEQSENTNTEKTETELETLQADLEKAKTKAEENYQLALRAQAELDNVRKRAERDVSQAYKFSLERFCVNLLPVIDSLERTLTVKANGDVLAKSLLEGVELTLKLLLEVVNKEGLQIVNPEGVPFDPHLHEAMSAEASDLPQNTVMRVLQKGYSLHGRLLRPALVIVSKPLEKTQEAPILESKDGN